MKFLIDFFPVLAFFIAYYIPEDRTEGLYIATAVAIVAAVLQVTVYWIINRRFEKMHVVTLVIILVLGGATLLLRNKEFFMWKPTAINWVFALAFLASQYFGKKTLVQRMMDHAVELPGAVWLNLNRSWVIFFLVIGGLNLYVAYNFAEHIWVNFKLFGILGFTLLFAIGQAVYMSRYLSETEEKKE